MVSEHYDWFVQRGGSYVYSLKQLQHADSSTCGHWCLYVLYHLLRGWAFQDILFLFSGVHSLKENDKMVQMFVRSKFNVDFTINSQPGCKSLHCYLSNVYLFEHV